MATAQALPALPNELLAHIVLFLVDLPAQKKLALSHVCRQWRAAALSSSQFWATINVHDFRDLRVLDALLERSGAAALHVHIDRAAVDEQAINEGKDDDWDYVYADDLAEEQLGRLVGHASRLRALELGFQVVAPFEEMLRGGLYFPVLETLVIRYDQPEWFDSIHVKPFFVNWLAPALRTLTATYVHPVEGWTDLLQNSPRLESLSLTSCVRTSREEFHALLSAVFGRCHTLQNFALVAPSVSSDDLTIPLGSWKPSSNLRSVELHLGGFGAEDILKGLSAAFLSSISITTWHGVEFPDDPMVRLLMRGVGRVVAVEVEPEQNVTLRDEHGTQRRLLLEDDRYAFTGYLTGLWRYICDHHGAANAVTSFAVTSENWPSVFTVLAELIPPSYLELRLTRDLWAERDGRSTPPLFGHDDSDETICELNCNARRVCFDTEGSDPREVAPLTATLRRIKSSSSTELCLRIRSGHTKQERWKGKSVGILNDLNASHDNVWTLCSLCAGASH